MKKKYLIIAVIIMSAVSLFAREQNDEISIGNTDLSFSTQPNPKGNKTSGLVRYYFSEDRDISSSFSCIYETRKTDSKLNDREDSLLLSKNKDLTMDLGLLEYRMSFFNNAFRIRPSLAFNATYSDTEEKGYFITSAAKPFHPKIPEEETINHVFKNKTDIWFFSPKLQTDSSLEIGFIKLKYSIEYIPVYYFTFNQTMTIMPLVSTGESNHSYNSTTSPYVKNSISTILFDFLEFKYIYEYQNLKFKQLKLNYNTGNSTWFFEPGKETNFIIKNYYFVINLRPNIFGQHEFVIGGGKRYLETTNDSTKEKIEDESEWIVNLGYESRFL